MISDEAAPVIRQVNMAAPLAGLDTNVSVIEDPSSHLLKDQGEQGESGWTVVLCKRSPKLLAGSPPVLKGVWPGLIIHNGGLLGSFSVPSDEVGTVEDVDADMLFPGIAQGATSVTLGDGNSIFLVAITETKL